jgi:hypothetical protein
MNVQQAKQRQARKVRSALMLWSFAFAWFVGVILLYWT